MPAVLNSNPNPAPPQKSKTRKKIWVAVFLFLLLIAIVVILQANEYNKWMRLANFGADEEKQRKMDEAVDRAIGEYEQRVAQNSGREKTPPSVAPHKPAPSPASKPSPKTPSPTPKIQTTPKANAPEPTLIFPPAGAAVPTPAPTPTKPKIPPLPTAQINFPPVTEAMRNKTIDCEIAKLVVFRDRTKKYLCANIYAKSAETIKAEAQQLGAERIILFGQYMQMDCFPSSARFTDPIAQCHRALTFMDNWQFKKISNTLGVPVPAVYNYFYLAETTEEAARLCRVADAVGCFQGIPEYNLVIYPAGYTAESSSFFDPGGVYNSYINLRYVAGGSPAAVYSFGLKSPRNCDLIENHEFIHLFNKAAYGSAPYWFDEAMVRLTQNTLFKITCPPGTVVYNAVIKENGQTTEINDFDEDLAYRQEPLSSYLVTLAEGNQCRKGIYMQIARKIKEGGASYLPTLYEALRESKPLSETAAAAAVYNSAGRAAEAKEFLKQNGCSVK